MYKEKVIASIIANSKSVIENNGLSYVPFDTEYGILVKNKDLNGIVVDIYVDGKKEYANIIIEGGSSYVFDRNQDGYKYKFLKATDAVKKHNRNKPIGEVEVVFRKEMITLNSYQPTIFYNNNVWGDGAVGAGGSPNLGGGSGGGISRSASARRVDITCSASPSFAAPVNTVSNEGQGFTGAGNLDDAPEFIPEYNRRFSHIKTSIKLKLSGSYDDVNPVTTVYRGRDKIVCDHCGTLQSVGNNYCKECGTNLNAQK